MNHIIIRPVSTTSVQKVIWFKSSLEERLYSFSSRLRKLQSQNCLSRSRTESSSVQSLRLQFNGSHGWKLTLSSKSLKLWFQKYWFNTSFHFESLLWKTSLHIQSLHVQKSALIFPSFGQTQRNRFCFPPKISSLVTSCLRKVRWKSSVWNLLFSHKIHLTKIHLAPGSIGKRNPLLTEDLLWKKMSHGSVERKRGPFARIWRLFLVQRVHFSKGAAHGNEGKRCHLQSQAWSSFFFWEAHLWRKSSLGRNEKRSHWSTKEVLRFSSTVLSTSTASTALTVSTTSTTSTTSTHLSAKWEGM